MSEGSTPEERTEMPTERRMGQLRKTGSIFHSAELALVVSLISGFYVLMFSWDSLYFNMQQVLIKSFKLVGSGDFLTVHELYQGFIGLILLVGPNILIISGTVALFASLAVLLQTDFNFKERKFEFKFNLLNPMAGFKRIISIHGLINLLKALFKVSLILPIAFLALRQLAPKMIMLMHMDIQQTFAFTSAAMRTLFWRILYVLIVMAIFDFAWGKYQWLRQNKMTKEEVKDERKAVEGDEATKRRIIVKGLQRIMQRIRDSVPRADVVITNPTHFAVALKYDRNTMVAPQVVAKGKGFLALRIRAIAKEHNIPVLERKPLARALYASTEIGSEIPYELFKAVAEVLAYVYKLKNPHGTQTRAAR